LLDLLKNENVIFVSGQSKEREQIYNDIKKGKYKIVITTKVFNLGVDFTRLYCLIIGNGGKSSIRIIQQIGRILRPHPDKKKALVVDFSDNCKYLKQHFIERYEILKRDFSVSYY